MLLNSQVDIQNLARNVQVANMSYSHHDVPSASCHNNKFIKGYLCSYSLFLIAGELTTQ